MAIRDFYEKTTKIFKQRLKYNGETPNLTNDTITIRFKKRRRDTEYSLEKLADVTSEGEQGIASFSFSPEETGLTPGVYFYEIVWESVGFTNVVESGKVEVLERL